MMVNQLLQQYQSAAAAAAGPSGSAISVAV